MATEERSPHIGHPAPATPTNQVSQTPADQVKPGESKVTSSVASADTSRPLKFTLDASASDTSKGDLSSSHVVSAVSVVLCLLMLRSGFFNLILVLATSAMLLLNSHVRVFLDLPTLGSSGELSEAQGCSQDRARFAVLDPASYFSTFSSRPASQAEANQDDMRKSRGDDGRVRREKDSSQHRQMVPLPHNLKESIDRLAPLVVRDFIEGWYTHHSFGYPTFPRIVRSTVDYMSLSIWTSALDSRLYAVDVATELLLTGSSVFLACLRRKRHAKAAADSGDRMAAKAAMRGGTGHWNHNEERIASLRTAMRAFFERHLPSNERDSDLVFNLVTEILTKQLWNLILTVGEPDFLNRNLVGWKEAQMTAVQTEARTKIPEDNNTPLPSRPVSRPFENDRRSHLAGIVPPEISATVERPLSAATDHRPSLSRPISAAPERAPSVPPSLARNSVSSSTATNLAVPDRSMISTPPSRSDSPMMPSFASAQAQAPPASYQQRTFPKMSSPGKISSTNLSAPSAVSPNAGASTPRMQSPPPYATGPGGSSSLATHLGKSGASSRTSSDLSDGFSVVVGGLGSAIKGIGKSADAIAGGIGGALISKDSNEHEHRSPPTASDLESNTRMDVLQRPPLAMELASSRSGPLSQAHNEVECKPPLDKDQSDLSDLMASQAAWPSNLPTSLGTLAEGENLPDSLKLSLRDGTLPQPQRTMSPLQASRMATSHPCEISTRQSRNSPRSQTRSRPQSFHEYVLPGAVATASNPHRAMSSLPTAPALATVLSRSDPDGLYDSLESFLENPPRPVSQTVVDGEGEELLRLQVGLATIERLVPLYMGEEADMFREDASAILSKARDGLSRAIRSAQSHGQARSATEILEALHAAVSQLGFGPEGFEAKERSVREALDPVRTKLMSRLTQLYEIFWSHYCATKASAAEGSQESRRPLSDGGLAYEPRRKESKPSLSLLPMGQSEGEEPFSAGVSGLSVTTDVRKSFESDNSTPLRAPKPRQPIVEQLIHGLDDDEDEDEAGEGPIEFHGVTVTVTEISDNVDRPNAAVDPRTFEFMCAVEPSSGPDQSDLPGAGGFVLIRQWTEVVKMDKQLRRMPTMTQSTAIPPLPPIKGRTSAMLSGDLEAYLAAVLSRSDLANTPPVLQFADRTRASAAVAKVGSNPFASTAELGRNLGKNFVEGVGAVGKAAACGLGHQQQQQVKAFVGPTPSVVESRGLSDTATAPLLEGVVQANGKVPIVADTGAGATAGAKTASLNQATGAAASASQPSQGLSSRALDALLTSIFALADEALSLTGAWSMRRGVVRLLQSVVRQSYSGAIMSAFDGTASSLSTDAMAEWVDKIRTTFWANGPDANWSHVKGAARSAKERIESEEKARAVVVSYAPAQAAFILGPGGRQACERGLEAIHGVICEDEGALDLVLTLVLRLVQML